MKKFKLSLIFTLILFRFVAHGHENIIKIEEMDWQSSIITDPTLSAKCKKLISVRKGKAKFKQKVMAMIVRNKELTHQLPTRYVISHKKLKENLQKLLREQELNKLKLRIITEKIIKKGCPSIDL